MHLWHLWGLLQYYICNLRWTLKTWNFARMWYGHDTHRLNHDSVMIWSFLPYLRDRWWELHFNGMTNTQTLENKHFTHKHSLFDEHLLCSPVRYHHTQGIVTSVSRRLSVNKVSMRGYIRKLVQGMQKALRSRMVVKVPSKSAGR